MWSLLWSVLGKLASSISISRITSCASSAGDFIQENWTWMRPVLAFAAGAIISWILTDGTWREHVASRDAPTWPSIRVVDRQPTEADTAGTAPTSRVWFEQLLPDTVQGSGTDCEQMPPDTIETVVTRWTTVPRSFGTFHVTRPNPVRIEGRDQVVYSYYNPDAGRIEQNIYAIPEQRWDYSIFAAGRTYLGALMPDPSLSAALRRAEIGLGARVRYRRVGISALAGARGAWEDPESTGLVPFARIGVNIRILGR